jgi:hypothetical protein
MRRFRRNRCNAIERTDSVFPESPTSEGAASPELEYRPVYERIKRIQHVYPRSEFA